MPDDKLITPYKPEPLPPVTNSYPELGAEQQIKKPNKFLSVLGGVASGALNFVAPGLGGILGNVIGGGGSMAGSYAGLADQQRQFMELQRYSQAATMQQQQQQQQMMDTQRRDSYQLLAVQHKVGMQGQEFSTVSNLMKSRHDSEMTAVNNIKS